MLYPLSYEGRRPDPSRSAGGPFPGPSHEMNLTVPSITVQRPRGRGTGISGAVLHSRNSKEHQRLRVADDDRTAADAPGLGSTAAEARYRRSPGPGPPTCPVAALSGPVLRRTTYHRAVIGRTLPVIHRSRRLDDHHS